MIVEDLEGKMIASVQLQTPTMECLKSTVAAVLKIDPDRCYFYHKTELGVERVPFKDSEALDNTGIVVFKMLPPQISWKLTFVLEYLGPLVAFGLMWLIYATFAQDYEPTFTQKVAFILFTFHFIKRELETLFVHKFSHSTMPIWPNLFKNCSYYWIFAFLCAIFIMSPNYVAPHPFFTFIGAFGMIASIAANYKCHIMLSNLRPAGTTIRRIPRGFLFEYVSCPNYTTEIAGWLSFSLMTMSIWGLLFTFAGCYQMVIWAFQKHKQYRKEFPDYPNNRKALIPFLI